MNVTFPTLMDQFHIGTSTVQWMTTGYLLVLAIIIPVSSFLKKRFLTKTLFLAAILFFISGIIIDAAAPNFSLLLLGRIIQGIGTGIALPLMFNIILEQVPFRKLGFMMGIASLITALAPAVGPSLGGMIVNSFSWRYIFIALLPILAISFFMGLFSIRQMQPITAVDFDWAGYFFLAIGFASLIFATSSAGEYGWLSKPVICSFITSFFMLFVFSRHSLKSRKKKAIINLHIFQIRPFTLSVAVVLMVMFICLGIGYLIPNYAQLVSGENAFVAGMLLLPGCVIGASLTPISGRLLDRFGARTPIIVGNIAIILSVICFNIFITGMTSLLFVLFYMVFSIGVGFLFGNTLTNGLKQLPDNLNQDGNAVLTTAQQLAGAIGTSVVTTIVSTAQTNNPAHQNIATMIGSQNAFYLLAVLTFVMIACNILIFYLPKAIKSESGSLNLKADRPLPLPPTD